MSRDPNYRKRAFTLLSERPDWAPNLCRYFRSLDTDSVANGLLQFLNDENKNLYPSQEHAVIECLLAVSVRRTNTRLRIAEFGTKLTRSRARHPYSRALGALLVYKFGDTRDVVRIVDRYLLDRERHPLVRKHLALCVGRLVDPGRLARVTDRLKAEPDPDLTDTGLFLEQVAAAAAPKIKSLVSRTRLKTDHYTAPTQVVINRLDVRDLILLNLCGNATDVKSRAHVIRRVDAWYAIVTCPTSKALLSELRARL